jgi:hypothetical protein
MNEKPKRRWRVPWLVIGLFSGLGAGCLILTAQPIVFAICIVMGLLVGFILGAGQNRPATHESDTS